jgi:hypothetical protein
VVRSSQRSGFTGHVCEGRLAEPSCPPEGEFAPLNTQGEGVRLAFFGSGAPNSLLGLSVDMLLGPVRTVTVSLGQSSKPVNLPWGMVLGVGSNFFGTQDYRVFADGGVRALWGMGGNVSVSTDPNCTDAPVACANKLLLKMAPENGGTEGSKIGVALLALQLTGAQTPAGLETFSSLTLDNLGTSLSAFTALQLPIQ